MEGVLHKTLSENIKDTTKSHSFKLEGAEESKSMLSCTDKSHFEIKNSETNEGKNMGMNGQVDTDSESLSICESTNGFEALQQKTYSPTLIESAFKVMKNLFSPDKAKSKSANMISPVKQHQSASGSPSNSIYITKKTESTTSESGIENPLAIQTGESSIKNQLNMNQVGVLYSPLTLESHNNTDESFLTTVSIIDDSFHSAITNLDENGETMKLETNDMDNSVNNSINLDVGDPCNETLENSEYCLENTTLRNGSFALEGTTVADVSLASRDGNEECWSALHINGLCKGKALDATGKVPVTETGPQTIKEDHCHAATRRKGESPRKTHPEGDNTQILGTKEGSKIENSTERSSPVKTVNMEKIFLNRSFNTPQKNSGAVNILFGQGEISSEAADEKKKNVEANSCSKQEAEVFFEASIDERDVPLEDSISTTTVVLNSVGSADLNHITTSLEDVSNPSAISPNCSDSGSACALTENHKTFSNEFDNFHNDKSLSNGSPDTEENSFPVHKPQINKSSISERDSSVNASNLSKIKLHKSDELIHHRVSSESPEGKRTLCNKKSSLDVSLIKNSEASKQSTSESDSVQKPDCGTSELLASEGESGKHQTLLELDKDTALSQTVAVSVISQQSYTVLTNDTNLNRPVIDSVIGDEHFSDKITFHTSDLCPTSSSETPTLGKSVASNYCNASLDATPSASPSHQKQSTPLCKSSGRTFPGDDRQMPAKSITLNLASPEVKVHEGKREAEQPAASSKLDSSGKTIRMFSSSEDSAEFSPVNPVSENEFIFANSVEGVVEEKPCSAAPDPKSTAILSSKEPCEPSQASAKKPKTKSKRLHEAADSPNKTFDKKQRSPQSPKPVKQNQTFDIKNSGTPGSNRSCHPAEDNSGCERLNATFDKSGGPPSSNISNKTFTKKTDSSEFERANQTFVVLESPECDVMNKTYDKNSAGKGLNQTFTQKPDSPVQHKLNETFDKKPQSTSQTGQKLTSPVSKITNQTFVKEKDVDGNHQAKDPNQTFTATSGSEAPDVAKNVEPEKNAGEEAPEKPTPQSGDQQNSDSIDGCLRDLNGSFVSGRSSNASLLANELSTLLTNEGSLSRNQSLDDLAGKLRKLDLNDNSGSKPVSDESSRAGSGRPCEDAPTDEKNALPESLSPLDDKLRCDSYLVQLIQEQFSSNDIEKICSVVDDLSSLKLSSQILKASEQFDKSIHENLAEVEPKSPETQDTPEDKLAKPLSPKSFDFLNSIQGKPTGRDLSRESLYVKFDPLVQPNPNSLIDFTKEGQALAETEKSPPLPRDSTVCEQLLNISPQKQPDDIVPPLTPLSHKSKATKNEDKSLRIKELQNEIYFLKNLYAERERANKAKMDDCEGQVAKLTAEACFLEDRLKDAGEREKALVKKMKEQTQSLSQLKIIMEEYMKVISKLTTELEALRADNQKQVETLSSEKDSYMTHLQNTEAAFTDVHAKYEKSKKTIVSLKANEAMYRSTIAEQAQKMEDLKTKAREAQEKALKELERVQDELNDTRAAHNQETARLRAQLRKTELKVEALQESLEQKIKENQQLTAICDELIEGKK